MSDCIIINVNKIIQSDLYYPRFLRPNLSTPILYEIQSDLHDSHLYYLRFLTPKFSIPNLVRPSTADNSNTNRGQTVSVSVSERNLLSSIRKKFTFFFVF